MYISDMKRLAFLFSILILASCENPQNIGPQVPKELLIGDWVQVPANDYERHVTFQERAYNSVLIESKTRRVMDIEELNYEWLDGHRIRTEQNVVYIIDRLTEEELEYHIEARPDKVSSFVRK